MSNTPVHDAVAAELATCSEPVRRAWQEMEVSLRRAEEELHVMRAHRVMLSCCAFTVAAREGHNR
jgi:hypothetical protein